MVFNSPLAMVFSFNSVIASMDVIPPESNKIVTVVLISSFSFGKLKNSILFKDAIKPTGTFSFFKKQCRHF